MPIALIGAGAAGCFCAINIKRFHPHAEVHVFERGTKALAKVAVTGGGRCNLTNTFAQVTNLQQVYPRGDKLMRRMLSRFSQHDAMQWFEQAGVRLTVQPDQCVFPQSQDAMEIVHTLLRLMQQSGVVLHLGAHVTSELLRGFDKVVVCTGSFPKSGVPEFLQPYGLEIKTPVPSLFTFTVPTVNKSLMGTVVSDVTVTLAGTKYRANGPLLLTHWGMSGPAILRLSSYAARHLAEAMYRAVVVVNWCGEQGEQAVREHLEQLFSINPHKTVANVWLPWLTQRHWHELLRRASVPATQRCDAINPTLLRRLLSVLTSDHYPVTGRGAYKEEFVTCGGVALSNLSPKTLESKSHPGLYFAGEVLDVDGITGGFNLQAAWSMGYVVAENIAPTGAQEL